MDYFAKLGTGFMMIVNGVNDGAALPVAPFGIEFGLSSVTAVDAAQVVLVRPKLARHHVVPAQGTFDGGDHQAERIFRARTYGSVGCCILEWNRSTVACIFLA